MEHVDKLLPLLILGMLGAILLVLLRRGVRERKTERAADTTLLLPVVVAATVQSASAPPSPVAVAAPTVVVPAKPALDHAVARPSTIDTLFAMIGDPQSLGAAFLLREVFDRPRSRRT